uniref:TLDc domain-containing protein n=1 Tax=Meloidogyne incognita TaxID=6306 RepID=A0A914NNI7_MELIC
MGNQQSSTQLRSQKHEESTTNTEILNYFKLISDNEEVINFNQFKEKLGERLSSSLWNFFQQNSELMDKQKFEIIANKLNKISSIGLVKILISPKNLFEVCVESANIKINKNDEFFVNSFSEQMTSKGDDINSINLWIEENCPRLFEPVFDKINKIFFGKQNIILNNLQSEILSQIQFFVLRQSLPTTIFWPKPISIDSREDWTLLYSSTKNGLSVNRFEANVFDYRGPTVAIFNLTSNQLYAIAADEEWRHSCKSFGGPQCVLFKFSPEFKRIDLPSPALYCNFKHRTSKLGLYFGNFSQFSINGDFNNVQQIEVWGCAGIEALSDQNKTKCRQKMQTERNAKVPLPGNWEENADKAILEMGGIKFSNERRDYKIPDK